METTEDSQSFVRKNDGPEVKGEANNQGPLGQPRTHRAEDHRNIRDWRLTPNQQVVIRGLLALLADRDVDQADQVLAELESDSTDDWDVDLLSGLRRLTTAIGFFGEGIGESLSSLSSGETMRIGGRDTIVVEKSPSHLILRSRGENIQFSTKPCADELVRPLADRWFDRTDPANWLTLGAYEFVDQHGNLAQARRYWARAARVGEPASDLLRLLELAHLRPETSQ